MRSLLFVWILLASACGQVWEYGGDLQDRSLNELWVEYKMPSESDVIVKVEQLTWENGKFRSRQTGELFTGVVVADGESTKTWTEIVDGRGTKLTHAARAPTGEWFVTNQVTYGNGSMEEVEQCCPSKRQVTRYSKAYYKLNSEAASAGPEIWSGEGWTIHGFSRFSEPGAIVEVRQEPTTLIEGPPELKLIDNKFRGGFGYYFRNWLFGGEGRKEGLVYQRIAAGGSPVVEIRWSTQSAHILVDDSDGHHECKPLRPSPEYLSYLKSAKRNLFNFHTTIWSTRDLLGNKFETSNFISECDAWTYQNYEDWCTTPDIRGRLPSCNQVAQ